MDRDSNLLFGALAVQLMQVTPTQLTQAASAWEADPSRDLADWLSDSGALGARTRDLIADFVRQTIDVYGGDARAALGLFGGEGRIHDILHGHTVIAELEGAGGDRGDDSVAAVQESPGRYAEGTEFGRGGMGRVLLVQDRHLGRDIALKELLPVGGATGDADAGQPASNVTRFLQEARITGQLEHPSIVPVYELGHRPDGTLYYTMRLVRGKTLAQAIAEADSFEERVKLLPHFVDLCQAVAYAHSRGIIHRDLKPVNVMVGEFGETVVLDWGLAKAKHTQDVHAAGLAQSLHLMQARGRAAAKTAYGQALGTPAYMSPEQAEGRLDEVDERSDIYSLGAVLYELLTGRAPFRGSTLHSILSRVTTKAPLTISSLAAEAPPELVAICLRAMQKDKAERYESAKALADEVQRFQSGTLVHTYEYNLGELVRRFVRKHGAILATAVVAACVVAFGGVGLYQRTVAERDRAIAAREKEVQARQIEQRAREEEHAARELAERESYSSSVLLAQKHAEDGFYDLARKALWDAPIHLRSWEWGYVLAACYRDLFTFVGHDERLSDVAIGPDGTRLATASWDGTAKVWDLRRGRLAATLTGHEDGLTSVAFSPHATRVATASFDGTARVWDGATGAEIVVLAGHEGAVNGAVFSPDGARVLTASQDKTAKVWDAATGALLATLAGHENNIGSARFDKAGSYIVTAGWRGVTKTWDAVSYRELMTMGSPTQPCYEARFSPDGARVVTTFLGEDGDTARVWHAPTGIGLFSLRGHEARVLRAVFAPDGGRIATASADGTGRVWDAQTGASVATLSGHGAAVTDVAFSPDGTRVVTASRDKTARVWDAASGRELAVMAGHDDALVRAEFTPDGRRLATVSLDGTAKLWDASVRVDDDVPALANPTASVFSAAFSTDGTRLVTVSTAGPITVWDTATLTEVASFVSLSEYGRAAIGPDGARVVTVFTEPGFCSNVWVWDVDTRAIQATLIGHRAEINDVAFSPEGKRIVTAAADGTARVWDAATGAELVTLEAPCDAVFKATFSPFGRWIATTSSDNAVRIWDAKTGKEEEAFAGDLWLDQVAFAPEGDRLLATTDEAGLIWDVETGELAAALDGGVDGMGAMPYGPSGMRLVGISGNTARVWDATTGRGLLTLPDVAYALFHPDGKRLLTVAPDNTAVYVTAAPFDWDMMPGDAEMDWPTRFDLYRQHRLAARPPDRPPQAHPAFDLAAIVRAEANKRLGQVLDIASREVPEALGGRGKADPGPGLVVEGDDAARVLARLCLRKGDRVVRINDVEVRDREAGLAAFEAYLRASVGGAPAPLTITVRRGERSRELRYRFLEPVVDQVETRLPLAASVALLAEQIALLEADPEALEDYDHRQARWHNEPFSEERDAGFWIDGGGGLFLADFTEDLGLEAGDAVRAIDGQPVRSSLDLLGALRKLHGALVEATTDTCTIEVQRGQFHKLTVDFYFE